jgi:hypothetical protein
VRGSKMLIMFVTLDGIGTERNISEGHKIM